MPKLLYAIAYGTNRLDHTGWVYFNSAAEALLSLYRRDSFGIIHDLDGRAIYLNVMYATDDLNLKARDGNSVVERVVNDADRRPTMDNLKMALLDDCQNSGSEIFYYAEVSQTFVPGRPELMAGRLTAYVVCQVNIFIPMGSFEVRAADLNTGIEAIIRKWYDPTILNAPADLTLDEVKNQLNQQINGDFNVYLDHIYAEPFSTGTVLNPLYPSLIDDLPAPADRLAAIDDQTIRLMALSFRLADIKTLYDQSATFKAVIDGNEQFWQQKVKTDLKLTAKQDGYSWQQYYQGVTTQINKIKAGIKLNSLLDSKLLMLPPYKLYPALVEIQNGVIPNYTTLEDQVADQFDLKDEELETRRFIEIAERLFIREDPGEPRDESLERALADELKQWRAEAAAAGDLVSLIDRKIELTLLKFPTVRPDWLAAARRYIQAVIAIDQSWQLPADLAALDFVNLVDRRISLTKRNNDRQWVYGSLLANADRNQIDAIVNFDKLMSHYQAADETFGQKFDISRFKGEFIEFLKRQ